MIPLVGFLLFFTGVLAGCLIALGERWINAAPQSPNQATRR